MKHHFKLFSPTWAALAASALIAACGGGGSASAPSGSEDKTPPTVTITDSVATGNATGVITFTFNFDEAVGGFTAEDVTVTGGDKGTVSMAVDDKSATLQVTPTANSTGTVQVSVAAGAFRDLADNLNTASASASQTFDTTTPVTAPSGFTGTCATPCIGFSEDAVGLVGFGGLDGEGNIQLIVDPADANNTVAKLTKSEQHQTWAGATVHLGGPGDTVTRIDPSQGITLRVYSPAIGKTIMVKLEGSASAEASATSTKAGEWETLTFNYPNALSSAVYNKVSVFPGNGTNLNEVYYIDELKYVAKAEAVYPSAFPLTFDDSSLTYMFAGFGGADDSSLDVDPSGGSNKVGRATKANNAEVWAGTTISTGITIPFSITQSIMTLRVYSPVANIPVRLKVEDAADREKSVETEATVTQANTWQTLTFNFTNQAPGTAALNLSTTYNKASVFFNFGTDGASGGGGTFYFDDLSMGN